MADQMKVREVGAAQRAVGEDGSQQRRPATGRVVGQCVTYRVRASETADEGARGECIN